MKTRTPPEILNDDDLPADIRAWSPEVEQWERERAENRRALAKMSRGNRFRLMAGLPPLPETTTPACPSSDTTEHPC